MTARNLIMRRMLLGMLVPMAALIVAACEQGGSNPASPSPTSLGSMAQTAKTRTGWGPGCDKPGNGGGTPPGDCYKGGGGGNGGGGGGKGPTVLTVDLLSPATTAGVSVGTATVTLDPADSSACFTSTVGGLSAEVRFPVNLGGTLRGFDGSPYPSAAAAIVMTPCQTLAAGIFSDAAKDLDRSRGSYALIVFNATTVGGLFP